MSVVIILCLTVVDYAALAESQSDGLCVIVGLYDNVIMKFINIIQKQRENEMLNF